MRHYFAVQVSIFIAQPLGPREQFLLQLRESQPEVASAENASLGTMRAVSVSLDIELTCSFIDTQTFSVLKPSWEGRADHQREMGMR